MTRLLPFVFLLSMLSLFGIAWIVTGFNPDEAAWYVFAAFVILLFIFLMGMLGIALYLARTKFYKRYSTNLYFWTSFKMAFFVAAFVAIAAALAILDLVSTINVILAIIAVSLFALWSYLGKKVKEKE